MLQLFNKLVHLPDTAVLGNRQKNKQANQSNKAQLQVYFSAHCCEMSTVPAFECAQPIKVFKDARRAHNYQRRSTLSTNKPIGTNITA